MKCILIDFEQGEITLSEASNTILRLFSVSQQRKLLKAFADQWNSNGSQLINDAQIGNFLNSL